MRTKMDVLGMKKLVLKLPKMFTSSVYNTPTKTGVLEVRNMRIVFHARKPTSKERKKERKKKTETFFFYKTINARRSAKEVLSYYFITSAITWSLNTGKSGCVYNGLNSSGFLSSPTFANLLWNGLHPLLIRMKSSCHLKSLVNSG